MQTIVIAGKLGKDAEVRKTQNGDAVCSFSVAVDQRDGREKTTNWFRVSLWGKRGEGLAPYLLKGASVTVSGEFSVGEYEGKTQLNIRANEIALQGGRGEGGSQGGADRNSGSVPQTGGGFGGSAPTGAFPDDLDDDIPFISSNGVF